MTPGADNPDTPDEPKQSARRRGSRGRGYGRGGVGARRLAAAVKARREEHGWTQQDVVQQGHLSLNRLQAIEAGRTAQYRRTTLEDLDRGLKWVRGSAARILYENGDPLPFESRPGWIPNEATTVAWLDGPENMEAGLAQQSKALPIDEELQRLENSISANESREVDWVRGAPEFSRYLIESQSQQITDLRRQVADMEDRLHRLLKFLFENTVPRVQHLRKSERESRARELHREIAEIAGFLMAPTAADFREIAETYSIDFSEYKDPWEAADQLSRAGHHEAARELLAMLKRYSRPPF